jgi:hypothetical protein
MIAKLISAYETRKKLNKLKKQLRENATSRAIIQLVATGALTRCQGNRLIPKGKPL